MATMLFKFMGSLPVPLRSRREAGRCKVYTLQQAAKRGNWPVPALVALHQAYTGSAPTLPQPQPARLPASIAAETVRLRKTRLGRFSARYLAIGFALDDAFDAALAAAVKAESTADSFGSLCNDPLLTTIKAAREAAEKRMLQHLSTELRPGGHWRRHERDEGRRYMHQQRQQDRQPRRVQLEGSAA